MPRPTLPADPALRRVRLVAICLLVAFCLAIAVITFWPGPPAPDAQRALRTYLQHAHRHGLPRWITFGRVEFSANVVMFLPIGLFGALSLARARWLVAPAAALASVMIELLQAARLPDRVGTPRDVIANTIGALLGYAIASLIVVGVTRRQRRQAAAVPALAPSASVRSP